MSKILKFENDENLNVKELAARNEIHLYVAAVKNKIADIQKLTEIEEIERRGDILRWLGQRHGVCFESQNELAEINLRLARLGGEILAKEPKNKGGRKSAGETKVYNKTLKERGFTRPKARRWERISEIPLTTFEHFITAHHDVKKVITLNFFEALSKRLNRSKDAQFQADVEIEKFYKNDGEKSVKVDELETKPDTECPKCSHQFVWSKIRKSKSAPRIAA